MKSWKFKVADIVPVGASGDWRVERVTISREAAALAAAVHPHRPTEPGDFTTLRRRDKLVMIDSDTEFRDHFPLTRNARGRVLLHGLGLGMAARLCLDNPGVEHVTVVEKSPDVIALVAPHYLDRYGGRLSVIEGDAFSWKVPTSARWNAIWHDIWDDIRRENVKEMKTLHRRFGRRTDWQGSWARWECEHRAM